jgi:hypothetical protein
MRKFVQGVLEIRSLKLGAIKAWSRGQELGGAGAKSKEQRAKSKEQRAKSRGRELETPRVSVIDYPFSVIRWTKGSRITGQVAAGRGERRLSVIRFTSRSSSLK